MLARSAMLCERLWLRGPTARLPQPRKTNGFLSQAFTKAGRPKLGLVWCERGTHAAYAYHERVARTHTYGTRPNHAQERVVATVLELAPPLAFRV